MASVVITGSRVATPVSAGASERDRCRLSRNRCYEPHTGLKHIKTARMRRVLYPR